MKTKNLKYIIGALILATTFQMASAQPVAKIGYFLDNATHKHLLNPALVPARGYFSYPGVGSIDLDLKSNLSLSNFLYPALNEGDPLRTFMSPSITPEQFLSGLADQNFIKMNQRLSLLSFGFYSGTSFWTFEVASRFNMNLNLPYDLFAFMKQGMSSPEGNRYEINNLEVGTDVMLEASLGTSILLFDNLRLGVKGKFLAGAAKATAGLEQLVIDMQQDSWTVTSNGLMNIYAPGVTYVTDSEGVVSYEGLPLDISSYAPALAGQGVAFDFGASWTPLPFLTVSAGIIDLGKVTWSKDNNIRAISSGGFTFAGMDNIGGEEEGEGSMEEQLIELQENLMQMAQFTESNLTEDYIDNLIPTINAGIEAGILKNKLSVGVLYSNRLVPGAPQMELTGMVNLKPAKGLNFAASYTLINQQAQTLGVAMGINLGIANIYIACDYIPLEVTPQYIPIYSMSTHFQAGLSISLGKMKVRK